MEAQGWSLISSEHLDKKKKNLTGVKFPVTPGFDFSLFALSFCVFIFFFTQSQEDGMPPNLNE